MAKKVITVLIDDLTGEESEEVQSHTFSLDGKNYAIELAPANSAKLFDALEPFIDKAVVVSERKNAGAARSNSSSNSARDLGAIREWAQANGYSVGPRGRIAGDIVAAYESAH